MIGSILRATVLSLVATCLLIPYGIKAQRTPEPTTVVEGTALLYFGLYAEQKVTVEAGTVVQVVLQLKLPDLKAAPKS